MLFLVLSLMNHKIALSMQFNKINRQIYHPNFLINCASDLLNLVAIDNKLAIRSKPNSKK